MSAIEHFPNSVENGVTAPEPRSYAERPKAPKTDEKPANDDARKSGRPDIAEHGF